MYFDWSSYIISVIDIEEYLNNDKKNEYIFKTLQLHLIFIKENFEKYNRKILNENNNLICPITKEIIILENLYNENMRFNPNENDIQFGHVEAKSKCRYSIKGLNTLPMSREGNRILGENSFIEDIWIKKLKNILRDYL